MQTYNTWTWDKITPDNVCGIPPHGMVKDTVMRITCDDGRVIVTGDSMAHFQAWEFDANGRLERAVTYTAEFANWELDIKEGVA